MIRPEVLEALLAAGATAEMIVAAVNADARQEGKRATEKRAGDAARQRKSRASRNVTVTLRDEADAPPNDIYSNPPGEPVEAKASTSPFGEKLVRIWNEGPAARGARKATKLDASRRQLLTARLRDHTEDEMLGAVANLAASKFHCGENDRGWRVHLGWMLKAENFLKALEMGDGKPPSAPVSMDEYRATMDRLAAKGFGAGDAAQPVVRSDRPPNAPRTIGQLAAGIASNVQPISQAATG